MCNVVIINKGEVEITTPGEFLDHFGFMPDDEDNFNATFMNECLCDCDIEGSLKANNIEFKKDWGDFYVGMLDED